MAVQFYTLTIQSIQQETKDCVSITLNIPEALKATFQYRQGQYLTFKQVIDGEEVRRSYSLCSSPLDDEWKVAVKKVPGGKFSTFANEVLKPGDAIEVMPPMGNFFTPLHASNQKNYVGIAAGSGITPLLSIIKTTLATEPNSTFTLVYGNKSRQNIIFKEILEALKNKYIQRFNLIYILSRERTDADINFGRIDEHKCEQLFQKAVSLTADEYFICGPEEMIFTVKNFLTKKQIPEKQIHFELFTTSAAKAQKKTASSHNSERGCKVTIKLDGRFLEFDLPFDTNNILDAALQQGADLPYACKGGVCCTCRAKLIEGSVNMEVNYALEPEEVEQGFVLTCQSYPTTEKVLIDFDEK